MRKWILIAPLLLAGCMTSRLEKGLGSLTGQPVSYAAAKLGYPDGERTIMGDHLYIWSTDHQAIIPVATGSVGQFGGIGYSQTNYGLMAARAQCTIQLKVSANDIVESWQYKGNRMGCRPYAHALSR